MSHGRAMVRPRRTIVLGVTDPASLRLLRGHPEHLAGRGWTVHVVSSTTATPLETTAHHQISMRREPAPIADLRSLISWVRLLHRVRPAVVMVGTPKAGLLGTVAAFLTRIPRRVYLVRGLRLETTTGVARWILWLLEWLTCRLAHEVVAVSSSLRSEIIRLRLCTGARVRVLGPGSSNGVDIEEFAVPSPSQRRAAREAVGLGTKDFVIGYVGRLHRDKGLDQFTAALEGTGTTATVLLVGAPEDRELVERLYSLAASGNVSVIIRPPTSDVRSVYWAIDVLCLPSRREGFPNVVLEAASCGIPAVVSDATGCRDAVIPGVTGWSYRRDNTESLGAALAAAEHDLNTCRAFGQNARDWVQREFARNVVWARMDQLLESEASSPRGYFERKRQR